MKLTVIFVALLSLLANASLAREFRSVASGDTLIVEFFEPKDDGYDIAAHNLNWPSNIGKFITAVNTKHGEFFVEVSNDSTSWNWLEVLKKNPAAKNINFRGLNRMSDGGLNVDRQQTAVRWLKEMGLVHLAVRQIPQYKPMTAPSIKIYPIIDPPRDEVATPTFIESELDASEPDTTIVIYIAVDDDEFSLGAGVEWVAVANGKPITVPAFTAEYRKLCWLFAGTGGYGSFGQNEFGSEDQKLFAASATWLPSGSGFGLLAKFVYASRSVESVGEYVQQGYGPYLGLAYRGECLSTHMAVGVQYFDRYQDDRRSELSATAGLRYNFNF